MEQDIKRLMSAAAAIVHWFVVVKRVVSKKAKLRLYRLVYVSTLICGHKMWIMTERKNYKQLK